MGEGIDDAPGPAFVAACGFLASAGFLRFVVRKPEPNAAKRPKG